MLIAPVTFAKLHDRTHNEPTSNHNEITSIERLLWPGKPLTFQVCSNCFSIVYQCNILLFIFQVIEKFRSSFTKVMSIVCILMTPKVHILLFHHPHFIRLTNMLFGLYMVICVDHVTFLDYLLYIIIQPT